MLAEYLLRHVNQDQGETAVQEAVGYSLWLVPPRPLLDDFRSQTQHYSSKYGTPYFEPHVTLVGGIGHALSLDLIIKETDALTRELAPLDPLELSFGPAVSGAEFYQCVFFKIALIPFLRRAHTRAQTCFFRDWYPEPDAYTPHLSIVYGELDLQTRIETTRELNKRFARGTFTPQEISLWRTQGAPDQWRHVQSFLL